MRSFESVDFYVSRCQIKEIYSKHYGGVLGSQYNGGGTNLNLPTYCPPL